MPAHTLTGRTLSHARGRRYFEHDLASEEARRPTKIVLVDIGTHDNILMADLYKARVADAAAVWPGQTANMTASAHIGQPLSESRKAAVQQLYVRMKADLLEVLLDAHPAATIIERIRR